jgi:hypothetical protein
VFHAFLRPRRLRRLTVVANVKRPTPQVTGLTPDGDLFHTRGNDFMDSIPRAGGWGKW